LTLFDVSKDPAERHDLATSEGEIAQQLFLELRTLRGEQRAWAPAPVSGAGSGRLQNLNTSGYVGREHATEDGDGD